MDIETLAGQVANEVVAAVPELTNQNWAERQVAITTALFSSQGAGADLMSAFRGNPSFGDLRGGWIQQAGGFGMAIQEHMVPFQMVEGVVAGKSAKSTIEAARAFAASPTSVTDSYMPVSGATITEAVSLGGNIDVTVRSARPCGFSDT